ncbi:peptidylprolyl isomerase [Patescibacteria group bacterium]
MFAWKSLKSKGKKKTDKKGRGKFYGLLSAGVVVGILVVFGVVIYATGATNTFVRGVTKVLPYPTIFVNGVPSTYNSFAYSVASLEEAFEKQEGINFSDPSQESFKTEVRESVLTHLVEDRLVRQLAAQYGAVVTQEKIDTVMQTITGADNENLEAVETELDEKYGWTLDDYVSEVVIPSLYREELQKMVVTDEELNSEAYAKALEVLEKVQVPGSDFGAIAKEYSEGPSAENGGDLGTTEPGAFVPEFEEAARALEPSGISGIVKTQYGFHIIKVVDRDGDSMHTRHILIQGLDFENWFYEKLQNAVIWLPLFGYSWEPELGIVQAREKDTGLEEGDWITGDTETTEAVDATETAEDSAE